MNKEMLMVVDHEINPDKYTKEQLKDNYHSAVRNSNAANAASDCADVAVAANVATEVAAYAACSCPYDTVQNWVNNYFELTGENKQDYIDAINKGNKQ